MTNFIIHIQRYVNYSKSGKYNVSGRFIQKRADNIANSLKDAYNKALQLNPGFKVSMIWPE